MATLTEHVDFNSKNDVENSETDDENSVDEDSGMSENENSESESSDADSEAENEKGNAGWANSMAKILKTNKPKGKKSLVLSKAKKHSIKESQKPSVSFEVVGEEGESKPIAEEVKVKEEDSDEEPKAKKMREHHPDLRVKPNVLDREKEKLLSKIATRGVVQLFNTVKNQQKDIEKKIEDAGPLERKKDKIYKSLDKNKFLDNLMGKSKSENVNKALEVKKEVKKEEKPTWNVFREDFMMGARMKDWDKNEAEVEENEPELNSSDSD